MRRNINRKIFINRAIICICAVGIIFFAAKGVLAAVKSISSMVKGNDFSSPVNLAPATLSSSAAGSSVCCPQPSKPSAACKDLKSRGWFKDAVFIGNSRTVGLRNYDALDGAVYYADKGLMVDTVYTKKIVNINGRKVTAMQALKKKHFGKVYIMFGINELGWSNTQTFFDDYKTIIDNIKKYSPKTLVYIQSIMPVSNKKSESSKIYTNENIKGFNTKLKKLAEDEHIKYLDIAKAVSDANGALPEGASVDGVHFNTDYCQKWCNYLETHA